MKRNNYVYGEKEHQISNPLIVLYILTIEPGKEFVKLENLLSQKGGKIRKKIL